jgi:ArsR family transcriptional regulator
MMNTPNKKSKSYDLQAEIFKVLNHPARLAILGILRDGEHCVCHMEAWLGYRQAYISQQLSVLKQAGLIRDRRDGWNIYYQIADERIYKVLDQVREMTGTAKVELRTPSSVCTCPKCSTAVNFSAEIPVILPIKNIQ